MIRRSVFLFLALLASTAQAHKPSDSYLMLSVQGRELQGQWDIALRDLDYAIGLDSNADGQITWGELRRRDKAIAAYALARLRLRGNGKACATRATRQLVDNHSDGAYVVLRFHGQCVATPTTLNIEYHLFADLDPLHRGLLRLEYAGTTRTAIFGPDQAAQQFKLDQSGKWREFYDYARAGIWHIWTGYDHLLFLLALLLPSTMVRRDGHWHKVTRLRNAVVDTVKIVTAFTVAHSITLSLAVLDIIRLPSRLVESVIAASVVIAALNNIFPVFHRRRWLMAFTFGLMHGFGFAAVLIDLGLAPGALAVSLAAFNIGVEMGQLAIVAAVLPLLLLIRHGAFYRRFILYAGSWSTAAIAAAWLIQRAFNLRLVPG